MPRRSAVSYGGVRRDEFWNFYVPGGCGKKANHFPMWLL